MIFSKQKSKGQRFPSLCDRDKRRRNVHQSQVDIALLPTGTEDRRKRFRQDTLIIPHRVGAVRQAVRPLERDGKTVSRKLVERARERRFRDAIQTRLSNVRPQFGRVEVFAMFREDSVQESGWRMV